MWVYLIKPDEHMVVEIDGDLSDYQKLVGGYIETVMTNKADVLMLVNEDGKFQGLKPNRTATTLMRSNTYSPWDYIVGNAVLVHLNDAHDDWIGWSDANESIFTFCELAHMK